MRADKHNNAKTSWIPSHTLKTQEEHGQPWLGQAKKGQRDARYILESEYEHIYTQETTPHPLAIWDHGPPNERLYSQASRLLNNTNKHYFPFAVPSPGIQCLTDGCLFSHVITVMSDLSNSPHEAKEGSPLSHQRELPAGPFKGLDTPDQGLRISIILDTVRAGCVLRGCLPANCDRAVAQDKAGPRPRVYQAPIRLPVSYASSASPPTVWEFGMTGEKLTSLHHSSPGSRRH